MNNHPQRYAVLAVVLSVIGPAYASVPGAEPVLQAVVKAANEGRPEMAKALTANHRNIPWIPTAEGVTIRRMFQPNPWKAAALEPPFTNGGPAAVFHTWHAPESDGDHVYPLVRTKAGWRLGAEISERDTQGYRITHHDLRVHIIPSRQTARITDRFTIVRSSGAEPVAYLRLSDDFRVTGLTTGGRNVAFKQAGGIVAVRMPKARTVNLDMAYDGRVAHRSMSAITADLAVLSAYYYPTLGRLPSTANVEAIVPSAWTAVTQGELVGTRHVGGEAVYRYRNTLPVNYFTLDAAPYTVTSRKVGGKTLYAYLLKASPGFADRLLDAVAQAMPYYESRFGPYPYSRYSIVDGGAVMGFVALEGYSMASYGTMTLMPNVLAHELSHTWWGGVVPNTYLRSWWNESFARYSDDACTRAMNNVTERHPQANPWWPSAQSVDSAPLSSARDEDSVNSIAYEKGRVVLDLLEEQLGQPLFDKCLKEFVKEERSAPDTDWPAFQRVVERVTGAKWDWFFRQWVRRTGWPSLELENVRGSLTPEGQWEIKGTIVQHGDPYQCAVTLRMVGKEGSSSAIPDGTMNIFEARTPFEYTLDQLPAKLVLDPDLDVPRVLGQDDIAVFDQYGNTMMKHSREEPAPSLLGGM